MKRILLFAVLLMVQLGFGQSPYTSVGSGNWNSDATWSGTGVPGVGDVVNIANGHTVTVTANAAAASVTISTGNLASTLTINGTNSLTVSGAIIIEAGTGTGDNKILAVGAGTLSANSITMLQTSNTNRNSRLTLSTGTITVSGSVDLNSVNTNNAIIFSNSGTLNIGGTMTGGALTPSTGTVNYNNGGAQTVGTYTYNNLTLSESGVKTFAVTSVTNNLTLSGTATATTGANLAVGGALIVGTGTSLTTGNNFTLTVTGTTSVTGTLALGGTGNKRFDGLVTINTGGSWINNIANSPINFRGGLTNNGTFTAGTGSYTFTNNNQALNGNITIPNVTVTTVTLTNNGTLTVSTALSGTGSLTNAGTGTLNIGGTSGITTLTASAAGNIVNYNGAAQTVKATSYSNLILSGSNTKTTTGVTVNGILSMEGTATASAAPTYGSAATLQYNTATARTAGAEWITTFASTGGVIIAGTGAITMNNAKIFNTNIPLTISNGSTLITDNNALTLGGNFTSNGTFTAGSSNITISGNGIQNIAGFTTTGSISFTKDGGKATLTSNTSGGNFSINLGAILSLGTGLVHTANGSLTLTGNPAGTANGSWGGSGSAATNIRPSYFASATGILNVTTSTAVNAPIDNNFASYGALGEIGGTVGEYSGVLTLTAPNGTVFINTKFASYGTPNGVFPYFTIGTCHATGSRSVTTELLGNTVASFGIGSYNTVFTDPCVGTVKNYSVALTYALPICSGSSPGLIDGSTPTGGTVGSPYTYVWSRSSAVNGTYTTISGATNEDYTPGALTATTFYKRTVTSGSYSDETIVIVPVIQAPTVAPTITSTCTNSTLRVAASTIPGTYVEWFTGSCGGTLYATGNEITPSSLGTYYARYRNTCGTSLCGSITITAPINPIVITAATVADICTSSVIQDVNLTYTYTGAAPNRYSIVWDRSIPNLLLDDIDVTITSPIVLNIPANTQAGTYTGVLTMKTSSNCISEDRIFTIKIGKAASVTSSTPVICVNSPLTITSTTTGTTSIGSATGLPSGVTASFASNIITISGTPTVSGTFNYSIPLNGSCPGVDLASGTIVVNALPLAPTTASVIQPNCTINTGTITINVQDVGETYSFNNGVNFQSSNVLSGLSAGTYNLIIKSISGCNSVATPIEINPSPIKTWTGTTSTDWHTASNWSPIGVPTDSDCVVIPNATNAIVTSTAYANTLTVQTGGQLTFENNSSLLQDPSSTTNSNSGEITYKRISSPMKNFDYTYWSSPVSGPTVESPVLGQTAKLLSPNTLADKYFRFDGDVAVNDWVFDDGVMTPGVGFIIRVPKPGTTYPNGENWNTPTYSQPVAFKGTPNNGNYFFTVDAGEFNLIGNPYPSAIDADAFINANGIINGALYFWTHNTAITNNEYTADDYASYTLTGSTATGTSGNFAPEVWVDTNNNLVVESGEYVDLNGNGVLDKGLEWIDSNNNNIRDVGEWTDLNNNGKVDLESVEVISNRPLGKIAAGQSFFVENAAAGSFQFTNAMRVAGNNSQFFKQANTKKTTTIEKNRVWLNLTNSKGAFKQLLVGYITGATNDWDNLYDGPTFDGQEFVDFYSVNQGKNLTIQGRALPFVDTDEVPLGYRSTIAGPFDISIDNRDGSLAGQEIWLEDKKTNTLHELSKGKYTFTAINGVENDRFVLKYTGKTLGTDDNEVADKSLIVSVKNKKITLTSSAEAITQVQLFDLLGRKVYDKSKINAQEWSISNLPSSEQTLIVKTTLANGAVSNKKIIY